MANYKISVESFTVVKDQRTKSGINLEGDLELRGTFRANGISIVFPGEGSEIRTSEGQTVSVGREITTVEISNIGYVDLTAEFLEIDKALQKNDDRGSASAQMEINGNSNSSQEKNVDVEIKGDAKKEGDAIVTVKFRANRI